MCRGSYWQYEDGCLDEVYLNGELVLYPLEADEERGWVRHCQVNRKTALPLSGGQWMISRGRVEVVRAYHDEDWDDD